MNFDTDGRNKEGRRGGRLKDGNEGNEEHKKDVKNEKR